MPLYLMTVSVVDLLCALKYSLYFSPATRSTFDKEEYSSSTDVLPQLKVLENQY